MSKDKGRPARTGERLVGIHLRVSPSHRAELQRLADQRGISFSDVCRELFDLGLRRERFPKHDNGAGQIRQDAPHAVA